MLKAKDIFVDLFNSAEVLFYPIKEVAIDTFETAGDLIFYLSYVLWGVIMFTFTVFACLFLFVSSFFYLGEERDSPLKSFIDYTRSRIEESDD